MSTVRPSVSSMKHVLKRPPEPNASPDPTIVTLIALGLRARAPRNLAMPAADVDQFLGHREAGRLHEVDRHQSGDIGDSVVVADHVELVGELLLEDLQVLDDA